ncbi:hypothetical protein T484DRAFT_1883032 [Baffinella frigidus]|nr:hypothetical protein T484DRAFT_1883032 [Cryptophyta sp. CCMP2293]
MANTWSTPPLTVVQTNSIGWSRTSSAPIPEDSEACAEGAGSFQRVSSGESFDSFQRVPSVCDQCLMTDNMLETSKRTGDRYWNAPGRRGSSSREPIDGADDFDRRPSSTFSRRTSNASTVASPQCCWPSLPAWPALDAAAFGRGKALLGTMEMDPACFSRDDLCHLALEIFQAAGLPEAIRRL